MPKALNQVKIVKKRTKKFFRHQSDRFKSVKVSARPSQATRPRALLAETRILIITV